MRICTIILLIIFPLILPAQTNISGIVNSYHRVIAVVPAQSCVRVDNTTGLSINDLVMIVQMKGATVSTTNNATFGSVSNLNNAGNYEISSICSIRGDSVFLFRQFLQSYTVTDKVQLVRIPQYNSATVTDSLKAQPWDSATGKGGVLAITVWDDLILNAPISANSAGYRGGLLAFSNTTCSNFGAPAGYSYNPTTLTPQNGAYKGESIASLPITINGGKGASANGGGGGNNHNNGGGGGANLSAGGQGGGNSSSAGCTVSNPGVGAYALTNNSGNKIFMGGGGGAGHANGWVTTGGGRGGGIIFIHANRMYSNGFKILSNGQQGGNTTSDGASGGGAGGTIILDINNYNGAVNVESIGGNGGTSSDDNTPQRCYGEGGGGSGGVICFKTSTPAGTVLTSGGAKGLKIFSINCGAPAPGFAGTAGSIVNSYNFRISSVISTSCTFALPVKLLYFNVITISNSAVVDWQLADLNDVQDFSIERKQDNGHWTEIKKILPENSTLKYQYNDPNLLGGVYQYRLKITEKNGAVVYSPAKLINIKNNNTFNIFPNPAKKYVSIIYSFNSNSQLKIYNDIGQLVMSKKILTTQSVFQLDVSFLRSGIYRLVVDGHTKSMVIE